MSSASLLGPRAVTGASAFFAVVVFTQQASGGELASLAHAPSLIAMAGCVAAAALFAWGRPLPARLGAMAFGAVCAAAITSVLGLVVVMQNLDKPEAIGPNMALAMIAPALGALLASLFAALAHGAAAVTGEPAGEAERADKLPLMLVLPFTLSLISTFVVLYAIRLAGG